MFASFNRFEIKMTMEQARTALGNIVEENQRKSTKMRKIASACKGV